MIETTHSTAAAPLHAEAGSTGMLWIGRVLSLLVTAALLIDAAINLFAPQLMLANMEATGFPPRLATPLGMIMLICAITYAIPRTAVLGAILITGFCGGAICMHVRLAAFGSPPLIICLLLGVMAWGGLYLRDARLRALLPLRTPN